MPDPNTLPDDDELENDPDTNEGDGSDEGAVQPELTAEAFAALEKKVADLTTALTRTERNVTASIGRYQSLAAKVEAAPEDTGALKQLQAQGAAVAEALNALLEDDTVDPKVKTKAREALAKMPDPEKEDLRARLAALEAKKDKPAAAPATTGTDFENELVSEIEEYGLNPDDPAFDWKGEATAILRTQGPGAVRTYFRKQIRALLDEQASAGRRQQRKAAAKTDAKAPPADKTANPLDESRPIEDRIKHLQELGAI